MSVEPRVFACRQVRDRLDIVRIYSRRKWIVPLFAHSYKQCNCEDAPGPLFDFRKWSFIVRDTVVRMSRCIWNKDVFWREKKSADLSLERDLPRRKEKCCVGIKQMIYIFANFYSPIFDAGSSSLARKINMDLTWLIPRKLLPVEPNWKYRDVATQIASCYARERGEKCTRARALHGENRSNRDSIDRSKALPAPHRCPAREPYRKRVEGKERTREWARVPRERKPTSWEGEIESGGR